LTGPEGFPDVLAALTDEPALPGYLADLARLELAYNEVFCGDDQVPQEVDAVTINPSLRLLQLPWKNLAAFLDRKGNRKIVPPERGEEYVLLWRDAGKGETKVRVAGPGDLLALKVVAEGIDPEVAATEGGQPVGVIDNAIERAAGRGILLMPRSRIHRAPERFRQDEGMEERFFSSSVFTLQWHITQECDLHCRHCYDRSSVDSLPLDRAIGILRDFRRFCRSRNVHGQVTFTGGNPLLYPGFPELYRAASVLGFSLAVLGNPAPSARIEELVEIEKPGFFQVSLEGLREHNDAIRGSGHFDRVIEFLRILKELDIYSMVMLTLTRENIDQVIPLAGFLRGKTDSFTFNRLSMVGEGANLEPSSREEYAAFLESYMNAAETNPVMSLKDNLFNIILRKKGMKPFGGCAGFGCGAAFNFITVLPDGEAHACRKFPSPIGNVLEQGIAGVYDSELAKRYRLGSNACLSCRIRPVCGGCPAVVHSFGLDIFHEKDPYCFMEQPE
jgi:selenobiotic family peptide radical SAM maturase